MCKEYDFMFASALIYNKVWRADEYKPYEKICLEFEGCLDTEAELGGYTKVDRDGIEVVGAGDGIEYDDVPALV
jgi:hypothetical protein